jgi:transcriptional regulator with XRE-family HTH domain
MMVANLKSMPQDVAGYIELTPGERLRGIRELMQITQKNLELSSGVKQGDISAIERGKKGMGLIVARRLADGLGIPVSRLFDEGSRVSEINIRIAELMERFAAKSEADILALMETAAKIDKFKAGAVFKVKRVGGSVGLTRVTKSGRKVAVKAKAKAKPKPAAKTRVRRLKHA